jgi:hypothetical protein
VVLVSGAMRLRDTPSFSLVPLNPVTPRPICKGIYCRMTCLAKAQEAPKVFLYCGSTKVSLGNGSTRQWRLRCGFRPLDQTTHPARAQAISIASRVSGPDRWYSATDLGCCARAWCSHTCEVHLPRQHSVKRNAEWLGKQLCPSASRALSVLVSIEPSD